MSVSTLTSPSVQCPECGVHSIVEYKPTVYHCLKCDFEKDLSPDSDHQESGLGSVLMGFASVLLILLILL